MKLKTTFLVALIFLFLCGHALALDFGTNITKYDREIHNRYRVGMEIRKTRRLSLAWFRTRFGIWKDFS